MTNFAIAIEVAKSSEKVVAAGRCNQSQSLEPRKTQRRIMVELYLLKETRQTSEHMGD